MKASVFVLAALALAGCGGNPQRLPVAVSNCRAVSAAHGSTVTAEIRNDAYKPISQIRMAADFYTGFRYRTYQLEARLPAELDPQARQLVQFTGGAPPQAGAALRCLVTGIRYLDGSTAAIPTAAP